MIDNNIAMYAILFLFVIIGGIFANRFKQPVVIGFLIAGSVIGPFGFNLINDNNLMNILIDFGAILLVFSIGIEFSIKKIFDLGGNVFLTAFFKIAIAFFMGFTGATLIGLNLITSIFIAIIFSSSSTVIIVKILEQKKMFKRKEVPFLLATLIIDDIVAVFILTILSGKGDINSSVINSIENVLLSLGILILVYLIISKFADRFFRIIENNSQDELVIFIGLGLCTGFASLASVLGLSPTIGAFFAGSIISSMDNPKKLGNSITSQNILLSSLFFIAIGTMVNFKVALENIGLIIALFSIFAITCLTAMGLSTFFFANMRREQPIFCGLSLIALSEFSLLISKEAKNFGITIDLVTIVTCIIMLSAIFLAFIIKYNQKIYEIIDSIVPEKTKKNVSYVGNYISSFVQHMSIENVHTKNFKKWIIEMISNTFVLLFALILLHKTISFLRFSGFNFASNIIIFISVIIAIIFISRIINAANYMHNSGIKVMSYMRGDLNIERADKILRQIILGLIIIMFGLISPIVIVMGKMNKLFLIASILIIISGIIIISRIINNIKNSLREYTH